MKGLKINRFWSTVATVLIVYALIKFGIPALSREVTALPFPLPVPGTLIFMYMVLTIVAMFLLVTFSDEMMEEFLQPVKKLLSGGYGKVARALVLTIIPLVAAWQMYERVLPKVELPSALRIQHPSSNFPKSFEALKNPFTNPSDADIDAFIEQAKANEVVLIPQVGEDVERWMEEADPDHMLEFIPTRSV
ncbi:MAG: hypothetical protein OER56_12665, partial [Hyphomicrobiales bacterium]|nr:hypothetical protein [Hyphomicrobiales bacterium]